MPESTQHRLGRVRPPRVQITYDVEIGDAIIMKQLPYVVGVMADLSGKPEEALPPVKARNFVYIDRDNIDQVLDSSKPRLAFKVPNTLDDESPNLNVELKFKGMDDFHPTNVVKQVPKLKELFDSRQNLIDLLAKLDGNDALDHLMQEVIRDENALKDLLSQAQEGAEETPAASGSDTPATKTAEAPADDTATEASEEATDEKPEEEA